VSAPATLYIDYRSPFSYLAKDLAEALERELGLKLRWLPYRVDLEGAHGHNLAATSGSGARFAISTPMSAASPTGARRRSSSAGR